MSESRGPETFVPKLIFSTPRLRHPLVWLFGGWMRTGDVHGRPFAFFALRKRTLTQYRETVLGSLDPYNRFLTGPTTFIPGKLLRKVGP